MNISPIPKLNTERLFLRKIEISDLDTLFFLRTDKIVNQYIERPESRRIKNKADAEVFILKTLKEMENNKSITWAICLKEDAQMIGSICLWNYSEDLQKAEVGYDLNPQFHNKGIMGEALKMVIQFGTESLNFKTIEAYTDTNNMGSKRLLEKNGFQLNSDRKDEGNSRNVIYAFKTN